MFIFRSRSTAKQAEPSTKQKEAKAPLHSVLRSGGSSTSVSSSSGGTLSSERKVRFSDQSADKDVEQRPAPNPAAASPTQQPSNGSWSNGKAIVADSDLNRLPSNGSSSSSGSNGAPATQAPPPTAVASRRSKSPARPLRTLPTLQTVHSGVDMDDGTPQHAQQAQQALQQGASRSNHHSHSHHRHSQAHASADPQQAQQAQQGSSHHSHRHPHRHEEGHRGRQAPPSLKEVEAAAAGEEQGQPGSLAESARLFHKYKDARKGAIGVGGFGRLLGDAGRLDSLRSPIAKAAGVKREMTTADADGDGWVDWNEFAAWFPTFQQQHYTQQRNHFYEEKGKEAEEAAAAAAANAAANAKAEQEAAAAEAAARRRRATAARAAARSAWEQSQQAAALKAAADAAVAAAGPDTPPSAKAMAQAAAEAAGNAGPFSFSHAAPSSHASSSSGPGTANLESMKGMDDSQLALELQRLELAAASAQGNLAAARALAAANDLLPSEGNEAIGNASAGGSVNVGGSASSASNTTPLPSPASGVAYAVPGAAASASSGGRGGNAGNKSDLDSAKLRRQLRREVLLLEAAAAAAAADTAAAAAAAAEEEAAEAEAEEIAAAAEAAAAARFAADPELQKLFAAFAAFGKNAQLQGTAAAAPLLDNQQFAKLCRDARLLGGGLNSAAVDLVFAKVAGKGGSRMTWRQFAAALPKLARKRGWPADEAAARLAACPGPQLNSETGTGRQSSFTGRSGSLSGSRPASLAACSEQGDDGSDEGDEGSLGSRPGTAASSLSGRKVGSFIPVRRLSQG